MHKREFLPPARTLRATSNCVLSLTTDKYVTYRGGPSTELYRVWTGPRKRSPPLPKITLLSYPHLGLTQGSANPKFN